LVNIIITFLLSIIIFLVWQLENSVIAKRLLCLEHKFIKRLGMLHKDEWTNIRY